MSEDERKAPPVISRRNVVLGVGAAAVVLGLGGFRYLPTTPILRPPGGQDEDQVIAACFRCEKCYEVCPRRVVVPARVETGVLNTRTPTLNFAADYCDWCQEGNNGVPLCVQVCPTEALRLPAGATAENTILGIAELNTNWCLAYKLIGCRFCYDACPYEAMELDDNHRPYVLNDRCNGCGACESVCVSLQSGSIAEGADERAIVIRPLSDSGDVLYRWQQPAASGGEGR